VRLRFVGAGQRSNVKLTQVRNSRSSANPELVLAEVAIRANLESRLVSLQVQRFDARSVKDNLLRIIEPLAVEPHIHLGPALPAGRVHRIEFGTCGERAGRYRYYSESENPAHTTPVPLGQQLFHGFAVLHDFDRTVAGSEE